MGANTVIENFRGKDVGEVFAAASAQARYEHGSGGYTGTFAEFPGYFVADRTIRTLEDAIEFADKNTDTMTRKWDRAAAIPYVEVDEDSGHFRTVEVNVRLRIDKDEEIWAGHDTWAVPRKVIEEAKSKVRLRKGETGETGPNTRIVTNGHFSSGLTFEGKTVTASATPGKAVTRYIIEGSRFHNTWETGFDTQAQARAKAIELLEEFDGAGARLSIRAQTQRETGEDLVTISSRSRWVSATVNVQVRTAKPLPTEHDGWVFFGIASS